MGATLRLAGFLRLAPISRRSLWFGQGERQAVLRFRPDGSRWFPTRWRNASRRFPDKDLFEKGYTQNWTPKMSRKPPKLAPQISQPVSTPLLVVVRPRVSANVPPSLTNAIFVAGAYINSMAVRVDGTIEPFESNMINFPSAHTNVIAIAVGSQHALGLVNDERPSTWPTLIRFNSGEVEVRVPGLTGRTYHLESTETLSPPHWQEVNSVPGRTGLIILHHTNSLSEQRFYRVRRQ